MNVISLIRQVGRTKGQSLETTCISWQAMGHSGQGRSEAKAKPLQPISWQCHSKTEHSQKALYMLA